MIRSSWIRNQIDNEKAKVLRFFCFFLPNTKIANDKCLIDSIHVLTVRLKNKQVLLSLLNKLFPSFLSDFFSDAHTHASGSFNKIIF